MIVARRSRNTFRRREPLTAMAIVLNSWSLARTDWTTRHLWLTAEPNPNEGDPL